MYRGGGEGAAKLASVPDVTEGDDGVGDGGAEVGPHHHGDGHLHGQATGHQTDDHRGDSAGGLHQGGGQDAEQQGDEGVVGEGEDLGRALGAAGEALEAVGDGADGDQDEVDQGDHSQPVEQWAGTTGLLLCGRWGAVHGASGQSVKNGRAHYSKAP
ncbi:hypothetical protein D3C79_801350 [compost metagenome]